MKIKLFKYKEMYIDLIFRLSSFWDGIHYSKKYKSSCITIIPCMTIRISKVD